LLGAKKLSGRNTFLRQRFQPSLLTGQQTAKVWKLLMLIPVLVVYTGDIRVVTMIARGGGGAAAAQGNVSASVDTVTPAAKGTS